MSTSQSQTPRITQMANVMVPVADQDRALRFYVEELGFEKRADIPFGEGDRWLEVAPAGGGPAISLTPVRQGWDAGRMTGIALLSDDVGADHERLRSRGVDVDEETMGGDGTVPPMFFFRDGDGNTLLLVQNYGS